MSDLITDPNFADADGAYAAIIGVHDGLSEAESHALNARLILILANHIGDETVLKQALELAQNSGSGTAK
ncbi:MAG: DUF2783 domain-containing protein [Pikeienuella sp.]